MDLINVIDRPSNIECGLCWNKKGTNIKQTYNFTIHSMVDLETLIALDAMTCIANIDAYKLHMGGGW